MWERLGSGGDIVLPDSHLENVPDVGDEGKAESIK